MNAEPASIQEDLKTGSTLGEQVRIPYDVEFETLGVCASERSASWPSPLRADIKTVRDDMGDALGMLLHCSAVHHNDKVGNSSSHMYVLMCLLIPSQLPI